MSLKRIPDTAPLSDSHELAALLDAARLGKREALEELLERYYPKVRALVHQRLERGFRNSYGQGIRAFSTSDIVQDVFIRVCGQLHNLLSTDEQTLVRYLAKLVYTRLVDALRHYRAERRDFRRLADGEPGSAYGTSMAANQLTPSAYIGMSENMEILNEVLLTFPMRQQQLLRMSIVENRTFVAIADALGYASGDVVRKAFHDAKARLLVRLRARGVRPDTRGDF